MSVFLGLAYAIVLAYCLPYAMSLSLMGLYYLLRHGYRHPMLPQVLLMLIGFSISVLSIESEQPFDQALQGQSIAITAVLIEIKQKPKAQQLIVEVQQAVLVKSKPTLQIENFHNQRGLNTPT